MLIGKHVKLRADRGESLLGYHLSQRKIAVLPFVNDQRDFNHCFLTVASMATAMQFFDGSPRA